MWREVSIRKGTSKRKLNKDSACVVGVGLARSCCFIAFLGAHGRRFGTKSRYQIRVAAWGLDLRCFSLPFLLPSPSTPTQTKIALLNVHRLTSITLHKPLSPYELVYVSTQTAEVMMTIYPDNLTPPPTVTHTRIVWEEASPPYNESPNGSIVPTAVKHPSTCSQPHAPYPLSSLSVVSRLRRGSACAPAVVGVFLDRSEHERLHIYGYDQLTPLQQKKKCTHTPYLVIAAHDLVRVHHGVQGPRAAEPLREEEVRRSALVGGLQLHGGLFGCGLGLVGVGG